MTFLILIFKNLFRHKTRTILTIAGISIGIATIVTLGLFTSELDKMMGDVLKQGDFDFTVAKAGSADVVLSYIKQEQIDLVRETEGVEIATGVLIIMLPMEGNPYFFVFGAEPEYNDLSGVHIIEGRSFTKNSEDEIIIGKIASRNLEKKVNDQITLGDKDYKVVGIYETGITMQDGGTMIDLKTAQRLQELEDTVNLLSIKITEGYQVKDVADKIEQESNEELVSMINASDLESIDQGMKIIEGIKWGIGLLAIVIGGIGVMNTMIMAVSERTREIGVLRALGWKRRRVLAMILMESVILALFATIIGSSIGILAVYGIMHSEMMQGFVKPGYFDLNIYLEAMIIALGVALVGGFYPAYKASKLSPLEALRYE